MVRYDFLGNGVYYESERVPAEEDMDLEDCHVFLMGLQHQIDLKEYLQSHRINIEIHDRDEIKRDNLRKSVEYLDLKEPEPLEPEETDPKKKKKPGQAGGAKKAPEPAKKKDDGKKDAKKKKDKKKDYTFEEFSFPPPVLYDQKEFGVASFFLRDLLNPYSLKFDQIAPVHPKKVFIDDQRENLDLNLAARRPGRAIVKCTNYFGCDSQAELELTLSFPLDRYTPPVEPSPEEGSPASPSKADVKKSDADSSKKRLDSKQKQPGGKSQATEEESKPKPPLLSTHELIRKTQKIKPLSKTPVFERQIFIFPYDNRDFLRNLQKTIMSINLNWLNIEHGNERDVRTRKLTSEEKESKSSDFVGGVEFIDPTFRMFILEGLSEGGMATLEKSIIKAEPNNDHFKIMRDSTLRYEHRLYADFDLDIKKVKLRNPLTQLIAKPEIYLREKVPLQTYEIIFKIRKILQKNTIYEVQSSGCYPEAANIVDFERNYGEALNDDDLFGMQRRKIAKRRGQKSSKSKKTLRSQFASEVTSVLSMEDLRESQQLKDRQSQGARSAPEINTTLSYLPDLDSARGVDRSGRIHKSPQPSQGKQVQTVRFASQVKEVQSKKSGSNKKDTTKLGKPEIDKSADNDSIMVESLKNTPAGASYSKKDSLKSSL